MLGDLLGFRQGPFRTLEDKINGFMTFGSNLSSGGSKEVNELDFIATVQQVYKQNGPVFACILTRGFPFSEARFQFQELLKGRPGRLFGTQALSLLENPWTNATTGELLWRMEQYASLAGNFFATTVANGTRMRVLRPDWVTIVSGVQGDPTESPWSVDAEVLGYIYQPTGGNVPEPVFISPANMVHYSPIPDPEAQWRGMSWITPLLDEIRGDKWAQKHKTKFFENGTISNVVVTYDGTKDPEQLKKFKKIFDESYVGADNAYKVIHMGGGADIKALGTNMVDLDFSKLSGSSETRIAAAAGVGSVIARFSEGMSGSSLNAGNYAAAKRQFADMTLRPLWRMAAASLAKPSVVQVIPGTRLWYDDRDIEFLKEDRKDAAEIQATMATTIRTLIDAGFLPAAVIDAVEAGDLSRLQSQHSGLYSVQLNAPGQQKPVLPAPAPVPALNSGG